MIGNSLEAERQAILDRMQTRRERYRRMLTGDASLDEAEIVEPHAATAHPARHAVERADTHGSASAYRVAHSSAHRAMYGVVPDSARHGPVVRTLMEHPVLCALGVAVVVAIGPRRIIRTVVNGGSALGAVAVSSQSNLDLAGQLLTMVGSYVQGRNKTHS